MNHYYMCYRDHDHFRPVKKDVTLSRVAVFGNKTKQGRCTIQLNERSRYSLSGHDGQALNLKVSDNKISQLIRQEVKEKKKDNYILGLFVLSSGGAGGGGEHSRPIIPRDVLHLIMSFIPAFPYYFMLRSVCRQWFYEFQDHIFATVEYLNFVDDGKPKYYFRSNKGSRRKTFVQFKPIGLIGSRDRMSDDDYSTNNSDKKYLFEFLAQSLPNVKHLRLGLGSLDHDHLSQCVKTMLPKLTQLETLDIVDTVNDYHRAPYYVMERSNLEMIARSLPSSTKNLNFIGVTLADTSELARLKMFSRKGRQSTADSLQHQSPVEQNPPSVDIQNLSLSYMFLNYYLNINDWKCLHEMYSHCEISMVKSISHVDSSLTLPVFSYVDYLNYMSKKEGIVLSYMKDVQRHWAISNTSGIIETVIDIAVQEYPYFQPLLSLPEDKTQILLESMTKLDAQFMLGPEDITLVPKMLELLTDPRRMKYPELVFQIDSTFIYEEEPRTLLSGLISECFSEQDFNLIKRIIETYKPSMAVNGVRNYLFEAFFDSHYPIQTELMKYLLCLKPDLATLGDLEGDINDEQKDLPLFQLMLSRNYSPEWLEDIKFLISAGTSLTQVDNNGNNVLHSACEKMDIDLVKYFVSVCHESLLFERNKHSETPLELIFNRLTRESLRPQFLNEVVQFACFKDQSLKDYETSCGSLLHASLNSPHLETTQWLLNYGFDANALNDNGENVLFRYISRTESCVHQNVFVDEIGVELIKAGAQIDLENKEGDTIVTFGLQKNKYRMIQFLVQTASVSSKQWSTLLAPRMKHGLNALHYLVNKMVKVFDRSAEPINIDEPRFQQGDYPVAKHCALLCLEHHPEMLYERSEPSKAENLKDICGVSPLQMLLEAHHTLHLLNDLAIKLSDIANQPVFKSKNTAPIPVMYLASEVALDIPLFHELMKHTDNLKVRDESRETKPNLLHIAAERSPSLCECIINHWKERYTDKQELSQLINQSLENDGKRPRNAAVIAWSSGYYEIVRMLCMLMEAADIDSSEEDDAPSRERKRRRTEL